MIEYKELDPNNEATPEQRKNLENLLIKLNKVRASYGKPLTVTSGLRSMKKHLEIYAAKGITDQSKIPMKSNHLLGHACDFSCKDVKDFQAWCKNNEQFLRDLGIWLESFDATLTWVHMQDVPYGSFKTGGSLWFNP
jgi:hypothetical protein